MHLRIAPFIYLFLLHIRCLGLEISNFSAETNERFKNDSSFIGAGLDLSGIGRDNRGRWATLISPNVFISAHHFPPSGNVTFYADNALSSTPVQRTILGGQQVANSDLYVGYLDTPVSVGISYYDFATSLVGLSTNTVAYQAGRSNGTSANPSSGFNPNQNLALGQNKLDFYRPNDAQFGKTGATFTLGQQDSDNVRYEFYEGQLQGGDSGSPLFTVNSAQEISLLGTAWYTSSFTLNSETFPASSYTFTGAYTDELNSYVSANSTQVPEPSSTLVLALASLTGLVRRRR